MEKKPVIYWFRNDLRLIDNPAFVEAAKKELPLIPVYVVDPRQFRLTESGFQKTGPFRTKFLLESICDLRDSFEKLDSKLLILLGMPEVILPKLAALLNVSDVYFSKEVTEEETKVENIVEHQLFSIGVKVHSIWQSTLYHIEDLPFPIHHLPNIFTQYRKEVEKESTFRPPMSQNNFISYKENLKSIEFNEGIDFLEKLVISGKSSNFGGGESAGLERIKEYVWETQGIKTYKETRNELLGLNFSSKFSPWLALGCISPRTIYAEVKKYENEKIKNDSTYWLVFELMWRDYFRFVAKKCGNRIFKSQGLKSEAKPFVQDHKLFNKWKNGKTGVEFIDANMVELKETGYMSNRGRQNVASYLINDLKLDWRLGAAYFESTLVDYDVCSNWGNWLYIAGVGNDPRENRYFNIETQSQKYDPEGKFVKYWLDKSK